jgi:prophage regulatory protein
LPPVHTSSEQVAAYQTTDYRHRIFNRYSGRAEIEGQRFMSRLLRYPELKSVKGIPYTRQYLARLEPAGRFPRRIRLGRNSVAWDEDEIDAFIAEKKAARPLLDFNGSPKHPKSGAAMGQQN